jgi:nucleotide-binding universal stress UspA family protein
MKNILVPVDFSENSRVAAEYALNLGEHFKSRVVFHHVLKTTRKNGEVNGLRQETREKLQEFGEALVRKLELTDVEIGTSVNLSPNIESIKELEKLVFTDIIVMGTKGASGTKEIFSGSNTVQVIDAVNLPVLVVPEEAVFKPIRNIMMCSDYDPVSTVEVFYPVKKLAKAFDAEVRIAHVKTDDKSPNEDRMMESRREGHYFGKDVKHSFKLIKRSDVVQGIEFYNNLKGDNDIVAILSRKHGLFHCILKNSHTHKLAYHSHLPLLVLKDRVQAPVLYTSPSRAKFVFGNTSRASFSNPSNSS